MPEGRFELRDVAWTPARVALAALMLVTAGTNLALTTTTEQLRFAILALGLLVGFILYFTDLWRPAYHLVGALYVVLMAAVWFVSGTPHLLVGLLEKAAEAALLGLFGYLLFVERRDVRAEDTSQ